MDADVSSPGRVSGGRLADLYARHAAEVGRLAFLLTGNAALASDLVQDAFVRLAGRFVDYRDPDGFALYLRKTVVNLARSHFRRRRVERAWLAREAARVAAPARPEPDAAAALDVRAALMTLPVRQRAAIVLRYYEDMSEEQIADALGCRPGTVKSMLSRGVSALREVIDLD